MSTRLDRLLQLLENGTSPATRKAAAQQIGDILKYHPHELQPILARIIIPLRKKDWETRTAAAFAIEAIAQNIPQWDPDAHTEDNTSHTSDENMEPFEGLLQLDQFDIERVLDKGQVLLGSSGTEYDVDFSNMSHAERMKEQRKLLLQRLGLGEYERFSDPVVNIDDEDISVPTSNSGGASSSTGKDGSATSAVELTNMSARELNRQKRLAKQQAKNKQSAGRHLGALSAATQQTEGESASKRAKMSVAEITEQNASTVGGEASTKLIIESKVDMGSVEEGREWPFEALCQELLHDIFDPNWEIRHGAGAALREIIRIHGRGAGRRFGYFDNNLANQKWLEDVVARLLCVFALDRFGDFVGDQVVAPVRETAAQALGAVLKLVKPKAVHECVLLLQHLLQRPAWQARHSALLGLKYVCAVREDMSSELLPIMVPALVQGLGDDDDDARAVAAEALQPIVAQVVTKDDQYRISALIPKLWNALLDLDELTASTASVLGLLAKLMNIKSVREVHNRLEGSASLVRCVPRLWPFMSHSQVAVRRAAFETLERLLLPPEKDVLDGGDVLTTVADDSHQNAWIWSVMEAALRHGFQRLLIEDKPVVYECAERVWCLLVRHCTLDLSQQGNAEAERVLLAISSHFTGWCTLAATRPGTVFDETYYLPSGMRVMALSGKTDVNGKPIKKQSEKQETPHAHGNAAVCYEARQRALRCLAVLLSDSSVKSSAIRDEASATIKTMLASKSVEQILTAAVLSSEWALYHRASGRGSIQWPESLRNSITASVATAQQVDSDASGKTGLADPFEELAELLDTLKSSCYALVNSFKERGVLDAQTPLNYTDADVESLCSASFADWSKKCRINGRSAFDVSEARRQRVVSSLALLHRQRVVFASRVWAAVVCVLIHSNLVPETISPIIKPLINSLQSEEDPTYRNNTANGLATLLQICALREKTPNAKVLSNLVIICCCDTTITPDCTKMTENGIYTLIQEAQQAAILQAKLANAKKAGKGRKRKADGGAAAADDEVDDLALASSEYLDEVADESPEVLSKIISRLGGVAAIQSIVTLFGAQLVESGTNADAKICEAMKSLWTECIKGIQDSTPTNTVKGLQTFEFIAQAAHRTATRLESRGSAGTSMAVIEQTVYASLQSIRTLLDTLLSQHAAVLACLRNDNCVVRHLASRCIAALCQACGARGVSETVRGLSQLLNNSNDSARLGSTEALHMTVNSLGLGCAAYVCFFVMPALARMSDALEHVRRQSSHTFSELVRLMPLEAGTPDPPGLPEDLSKQRIKDREFIDQLMNVEKLEKAVVPASIKAELRSYQRAGVSWLQFLRQYNLHGILCDDMGLGKTLQSICAIVSEREERKQANLEHRPALVICPPTLTGHWFHEFKNFCAEMKVVQFVGTTKARDQLISRLHQYDVVVAPYDAVRRNVDDFTKLRFSYCILDEGHIIKNSTAKMTIAIKQVQAQHRLILSGTPIQNNVLELWSLFDFLMPGYLGTERQFNDKYGKPIKASRDAKSNTHQQQAGALAMEALHRQVLPFLLRRMKEDVLADLPPKIIQDHYCELSELQQKMYEDFGQSAVKTNLSDEVRSGASAAAPAGHVFQALQYLRKLCNHPALAITPKHPQYTAITNALASQNSSLRDIEHAPKLLALEQLLLTSGIGTVKETTESKDAALLDSANVGHHRVLLFCQMKSMLDIVEQDLLKARMPSVSYLRLDGGVEASKRHDITTKFNGDPTIDMLLLTTHVGGLGLNLTGADTVIFFEHDWNPMKDLQAMDRAHRIGQKRVVTVYRLITRGTLEEKIMGLQKFKLNIANSVITKENSSLRSMDPDQVLDLFSVSANASNNPEPTKKPSSSGSSLSNIIQNLESLWDEDQYDNEYNVDSFLSKL